MTALCYNSGGRETKDGETGVGETRPAKQSQVKIMNFLS